MPVILVFTLSDRRNAIVKVGTRDTQGYTNADDRLAYARFSARAVDTDDPYLNSSYIVATWPENLVRMAKPMGKVFYVVIRGRALGIYNDWQFAKPAVNGLPDAIYGAEATWEEAEYCYRRAFESGLVEFCKEDVGFEAPKTPPRRRRNSIVGSSVIFPIVVSPDGTRQDPLCISPQGTREDPLDPFPDTPLRVHSMASRLNAQAEVDLLAENSTL